MSLEISQGSASLFNEKKYSDAVVYCGGQSWYVHQAILCGGSGWFAKVFKDCSKESGIPMITLKDMSPEQAEWLLRFVYTGRPELQSFPDYSNNPFTATFQASCIADFFKLERLEGAVAAALWTEIEVLIQPLQNLPYDSVLNTECKKIFGDTWDISIFWERFFHGVRLAYTSEHNVENLRHVFVEFGVRTLHTPTVHQLFLDGLKRETRLATDILCTVLENSRAEHPSWNRKSCSHCPRSTTDRGLNIARVHHHSAASWTCSDCHVRQMRNVQKREREKAERDAIEEMEAVDESQSEDSLM